MGNNTLTAPPSTESTTAGGPLRCQDCGHPTAESVVKRGLWAKLTGKDAIMVCGADAEDPEFEYACGCRHEIHNL